MALQRVFGVHNGLPESPTLPALLGHHDEEDPDKVSGLARAELQLLSASSSTGGSDDPEVKLFPQRDSDHNESIQIMDELRRRKKLCDVRLHIGEVSFDAHKVVLASSIPYFYAMFTHDMAESKQFDIVLGNGNGSLDTSSFEALLNFAYGGQIAITTANVQSVMMAATYLQMNPVKEACANFMHDRISPSNALGLRTFAESLGCISLVQLCTEYIHLSYPKVAAHEEFLDLTVDQLADLIQNDDLNVTSEAEVFHSVMRWVKHQVEHRVDHLPSLLSKVRLPLLSPRYLSDQVASEPLIRSSHKCRDLLDEARDFHLMPERRYVIPACRIRPRKVEGIIGVIYAVGGQTKSGNSLSSVEVYDPYVGQWTDVKAMWMLRSRVGVAVIKNRLYAIGGYNGFERLNDVEVFDAKARQWSVVSSMHLRRSAVGAVAVGDYLYVCGGFDGVSSLNTVERYHPGTNEWSMVSSMIQTRSAAGVCQLFGKIYVLGGHNGLSIFSSVECYDIHQNVWTECQPMKNKRCRLGVAVLAGKIYACGGYNGSSFLDSVEVFDPVTNEWCYATPMNSPRSRVALAANMGRLWAIGGYDGVKNLSSVEMYNPQDASWQFVAPMAFHEGGVGVGVIPNQEQ